MTESTTTQAAEVIVHRGYHIRLTRAGLEWIAVVAVAEQRAIVIMTPDRETALNKVYEWIDRQTASGKASQ